MVFCHTFSNISKRASAKAPSFFDSSYHLRNYTQLAAPDLFTSNTSRGEHYNHNTNNHSNNFPKFQNGIYSYTLILDPYTSGLALYNSTNNKKNNNQSPANNSNKSNVKLFNFSDESQSLTSNKFLISIPNTISTVNESLKHTKSSSTTVVGNKNSLSAIASPHSVHKSSSTPVVTKNNVSQTVSKKSLGNKRTFATVSSSQSSLVSSKKNKLDDNSEIIDPLLLQISGVAPPIEKSIPQTPEDLPLPPYFQEHLQHIQQQQQKYSNSPMKKQHLKYITDLIQQSPSNEDGIVFSNLLNGMRNAIASNEHLKIYPIYQAMKRNQCVIPVTLYNIILYNMNCLRDIPGECIEAKLTSILNVYSDLISMKMKPDTQSYTLVINSLLQGAFKSYDLYLNRNSQELAIDDDGNLGSIKSNNGENFFRLALEIFMACNFTNLQQFNQDLYESLLMGLNLFNYRFKNFTTFQKFLHVLNSSPSFEKNGFYYINMIKYSINLEHILGAEEENNAGFEFLLEVYNEYKACSKLDLYLLSSQYKVYAVLMYSLCQFNNANIATKILDNILLSSKQGKASSSYTSNFNKSTQLVVNQIAEIHLVIMFYLHSLLTVSTSKSLQLFEKFKKFDMIVMDSDIVKQYFINLMIICCSNISNSSTIKQKQENIEMASYIFENYFMIGPKFNTDRSIFEYSNSEDYLTLASPDEVSKFDKCKFLMKSIIKNHQPDVFSLASKNGCNSLNKALSMYMMLCLNVNNLKHVEMFLKFDDDVENNTKTLSNSSLQLIKYLNEESLACLVIVAVMNKFSKEEIFSLLDSVVTIKRLTNEDCIRSEYLYAGFDDVYLNGFLVNLTLSKLCQDSRFIQFMKDNSENLFTFLNGVFFKSCVSEFSIKSFILSCETSSNFHLNKFMGLVHTWYEFSRTNKSESTEACETAGIKSLMKVIYDEFDNVDHYYLMHNIKSELIQKKFTAENQNLSVTESNFLGQLNILEVFKNDIICSYK